MLEGIVDGISNYLNAQDQPFWIRGAVVALLLVALVHWSREIWASLAGSEEAGKEKAKDASEPSLRGASASAAPPARQKGPQDDGALSIQRNHSHASGFLELEQSGDVDHEEKQRAGCGLFASKAVTVEKFGLSLQRMIRSCRHKRSSNRIRIFDDYEVDDTMGSTPMKLTECRCTQFQRLREASNLTEQQYEHSMCAKPFSGGKVEAAGKSGSFFMRTHDDKYVLKTIEEHEFVCLKDILPHMVLFLESNRQSLLCRFLGAYSLEIDGKMLRFVVMGNVLPHKPSVVYDLKGTSEDRWVDPSTKGVLKDNNFNECSQRMMFPAEHAHQLVQQVQDDAEFLNSLGVMDYSLLVGITQPATVPALNGSVVGPGGATVVKGWLEKSGTLDETVFQLGIIDYLQRWTPKKVMAHWLKKSTIGCFHDIDTEPPAVYFRRFYGYLHRKMQNIDNRR